MLALAESLFSLAVITAIAFICPFLASITPGKWIQSSALVLILGAVVGPHALGLVNPDAEGMHLLKSLGLAFIFLMGGYELSPKAVLGKTGRHAIVSWLVSFGVALGVGVLIAHFLKEWSQITIIAFAIAMASTSYGKVEADVESRRLGGTRFAHVVASYGATGELLPVVATALLISEKAPLIEVSIMVGFTLLAIVVARYADHVKDKRAKLEQFVEKSDNSSQMMLQLVIAITVAMVALGVVLGADMIVAGFAAGYVLKKLIPEDEVEEVEEVESKGAKGKVSQAAKSNNKALTMLKAVSYGFFIPIAFVLSGCEIDVTSGANEPWMILAFVGLLLVIRGVPVLLGVTFFTGNKKLPLRQRIAVALYACTTMSTIVAMTSVAVEAGDMAPTIASTLVFAAAIETIALPLVERFVEPAEVIRDELG